MAVVVVVAADDDGDDEKYINNFLTMKVRANQLPGIVRRIVCQWGESIEFVYLLTIVSSPFPFNIIRIVT